MRPLIAGDYEPFSEESSSSDPSQLQAIIKRDSKLENIYSPHIFILKANGIEYQLESQILKKRRDLLYLTDETELQLYIRKGVLEDCDYPANNSLYMMLLSGNTILYGDEQRMKQEHIMTHQVFTNTLKQEPSDKEGYYTINITKILSLYYHRLSEVKPNNLFFTTSELRDYHYAKQKKNAYYHIQAINLPFQNIEFFYVNCKEALKHD